MITVLTVCAGLEPEAVVRLHRGVERHMPPGVDFEFICLNDILETEYEQDGIHWMPLKYNWPKHYAKVEMWRPDLEKKERILFFDLSCVIQNDLTPLVSYTGDFCVVSDFYWGTPCQSICSFTSGAGRKYFTFFRNDSEAIMKAGEQSAAPDFHDQILMNLVDREGPVDYWPDGVVVSYKIHGPQAAASVVKFHGKPKPEDVPWAKEMWQSNISFPVLPRRPRPLPDRVLENIRHALSLGIEQPPVGPKGGLLSGSVCFVGPEGANIKHVQQDLADEHPVLVGLDGGAEWLVQQELKPDIAILVDPPKRIPPAHRYMILSRSPKEIFDQVGDTPAWIFHAALNAEQQILLRRHYIEIAKAKQAEEFYVFGCRNNETTAPMNIGLIAMKHLGYTKISLHGYHCCGDGEEKVKIQGKTYYCSPEQYDAAREFVELLRVVGDKIAFRIRGNGLLAAYLKMGATMGAIHAYQ